MVSKHCCVLQVSCMVLQVRLQFGVVGPSEIGRSFSASWYLKWRYEVEMEFESRKTDGILWFLWFLIRSTMYGFVLFNVFQLMRRKIPKLLGYGPLLKDPKVQKWRKLVFLLLFGIWCNFLMLFVMPALLSCSFRFYIVF